MTWTLALTRVGSSLFRGSSLPAQLDSYDPQVHGRISGKSPNNSRFNVIAYTPFVRPVHVVEFAAIAKWRTEPGSIAHPRQCAVDETKHFRSTAGGVREVVVTPTVPIALSDNIAYRAVKAVDARYRRYPALLTRMAQHRDVSSVSYVQGARGTYPAEIEALAPLRADFPVVATRQ